MYLFTARRYASTVYTVVVCLSVCQSHSGRAGFKGGPGGPGPQDSHQQGASHQTLHIFFVCDMCVHDCM